MNYLLDIRLDYITHTNRVKFLFTEALGGDVSPMIKSLNKLLEKPIEEFTPRDWGTVTYVLLKTRGKENE